MRQPPDTELRFLNPEIIFVMANSTTRRKSVLRNCIDDLAPAFLTAAVAGAHGEAPFRVDPSDPLGAATPPGAQAFRGQKKARVCAPANPHNSSGWPYQKIRF